MILYPELPNITLENIKHFIPEYSADETFFRTNKTPLIIACLVSDDLYWNIKYDANIVLVTKANYKTVLKYSNVDFLLVNDCAHSITGESWDFQDAHSDSSDRLQALLSIATELGVPKVLWITENDTKRYSKSILDSFDRVYEVNACSCDGKGYSILTWPIQPRLHTPISMLPHSCDGKVWVDGIFKAERLLAEFGKGLFRDFNFSILESGLLPFTSSLNDDVSEFFKGTVSRKDRISGIRHSLAYISCDYERMSCKTEVARDLEVAATGVPVLHYGSLGANDPRKGVISEFETTADLFKELVRLRDDIYRLRNGLLSCRKLHLKHTVNHKLARIARDLNIDYKWDEYPKVSLLCGTIRKGNIPTLLDTFQKLNYLHKELIILYNGTDSISKEEGDLIAAISNARIYLVNTNECLGGALNLGIDKATGEYIFKIDDDDTYSENYIRDMILFIRSLNIDIFGKPHVTFFHFEGENNCCLRTNKRSFNYCGYISDPRFNGKQLLVGNSIAGQAIFLKENGFTDRMPKHTDSGFFYRLKDKKVRFAILDPFNMIVNRRSNQSEHTWSFVREDHDFSLKPIYQKQEAIL